MPEDIVLEPARPDQMADRRLLTVVVSVLVTPDGRLLYGSVIDVEEGVHARFNEWPGLAEAAAEWVAERLAREASDDAPKASG